MAESLHIQNLERQLREARAQERAADRADCPDYDLACEEDDREERWHGREAYEQHRAQF